MSIKINANTKSDFQALLDKIQSSELYDIEAVRDSISEQIFRIMDLEDVTKAKLAERLGKSRAYITKLLQGNGNFTIETLVKIARALGYTYKPRFIPANIQWEKQIEFSKKISISARVGFTNFDVYPSKEINRKVIENEPVAGLSS